MKIKNIDGLTAVDLQNDVRKGGKFVYYSYTISLIVVTYKKTSGVYLIREDENAIRRGFPWTFTAAIFGWWGIPFGPKYTFESIRRNMKGGHDVTDEVMATVAGHLLFREAEKQKANHQ